ncbi:hypothetical protein Tco_0872349 [Tanacetum coccineum]
MQSCSEFFPLLLPEPQKDGWTNLPQELSIPGISLKSLYPKGSYSWESYDTAKLYKQFIHAIDHSQKWHDGMSSRKIGSSSSNDRLADLVNKLDNLGRDMKKLKESVYAIQVGCQICERSHLDKDCPLNEEVKQVEEHQEESVRRSTKMEVWIKKLQENVEINNRNQNASLKNLETQIEQLAKEIHSDKTLSLSLGQIKIITTDQEMFVLNKLHGVSFISETETPEAL